MNELDLKKLSLLLDLVNESQNSYKFLLYLIPISGIIFGCTLLFFLFYWYYKQRIEIIRAGLYKKEKFDIKTYSLFIGFILVFVGFFLSLTFIVVLGKSLAILGGVIPFSIGLGLLFYYKYSE